MKRVVPLVAACAVIAACSDSSSGPVNSPTVSATASINPRNNLSVLVDLQLSNTDSVRISSVEGASSRVTPFFTTDGATARIPVLGLKKQTAYTLTVEAIGPGGSTVSSPVAITTGDLPDLLKPVRIATLSGTNTTGYMLTTLDFGTTVYALAFDSAGTIAWYREFLNAPTALAFSQQPNGNFTIFLGESLGWEPVPGAFVELTPSGEEVRQWNAPTGFFTDGHEILLTKDGAVTTAHLFGYTLRQVDATSIGGTSSQTLTQHTIRRVRGDGTADLVWDSWTKFGLADWIEPPVLGLGDIDHPNSLYIAPDGNYIVSWRNAGEVTKINRTTGDVIWRLGGRNNQFTIVGDPLNGFSAQHYARLTPQGTLLLYDNGSRHNPSQSRGVEYRLDETAKTATMIREFRHNPLIFTPFVGSAQRLDNGNTFMGWGFAGAMTEYSSSGAQVWDARIDPGTASPVFYRVVKTYSLYRFASP